MLTSNHDKRRHSPAGRINTLDHCGPFPIARLHHLSPSTAFRTCHNHCGRDLAHHKPSLVKVPDVIFMDPILGYHVSYAVKPALYYRWIFTLSPLIVVLTRKTRS